MTMDMDSWMSHVGKGPEEEPAEVKVAEKAVVDDNGFVIHTIDRTRDTLIGLAMHYGVSERAISNANGLVKVSHILQHHLFPAKECANDNDNEHCRASFSSRKR